MKHVFSIFVVVALVCLLTVPNGFAATGIIIGGSTNGAPPATLPADSSSSGSFVYGNSDSTSNSGNGNIVIGSGTYGYNASNYSTSTNSGIYVVNAGGTPVVTKSPTSETVDAGGTCVFVANADNADTYTWYITDAGGTVMYPASSIGTYVQGASASGYDTSRLVLYGVPETMNGWTAQCQFSNAYGTSYSGSAWINVVQVVTTPTPEPTATPTPMPTLTPTPAPTPTPTPAPTPTAQMYTSGGNSNVNGTGALSSGSSSSNGSGALGSGSTPVEPSSGSGLNSTNSEYTSLTGTSGSGIDDARASTVVTTGTASRANTGAYILAAAAGAVIIGAIVIMALYMKGKISLGKFENVISNETASMDGFEDSEFYNPDDFKPEDHNRKI